MDPVDAGSRGTAVALRPRQPPLGDIAVAAIVAYGGVVLTANKWPPLVGTPVMLALCAGVLALACAWPGREGRAAVRQALRLSRPDVELLAVCLPLLIIARACAVVWERGLEDGMTSSAFPPVSLAVAGLLVGPILEEIIFRGCLMRSMELRWGLWPGVLGSALVFAVVHGVGWPLVLEVLVAGVLLALMVVASGSLWAGVAAHIVSNATAASLDRAGWPSHAAAVPSSAPALAAALGGSALVALICWRTIRKAAGLRPA